MHILDADTLTHLHAGRPKVVDNLKRLDDPDVKITIVTGSLSHNKALSADAKKPRG